MKYHFRIHKEKDGYWTESVEDGLNANTQADTLEAAFFLAKISGWTK